MNEPTYAATIRYAIGLGYKVAGYEYDPGKKGKYWDDSIKLDKNGSLKYISYEPRDSMIIYLDEKGDVTQTVLTSVREKAQAGNILKVIRDNPGSKFVIHVGFGHLYESGPMMGAQLKELLNGEDLLTIDQQALSRSPVIDTIKGDTIVRDYAYTLWDRRRQKCYPDPARRGLSRIQRHSKRFPFQARLSFL